MPLPFLSFRRPSPLQPHIDQGYLFATTCGGRLRPHRGVEFNVPPGAPIVAAGDGAVRRVTPAEDGARVFVDHDGIHDGWIAATCFVHCRRVLVEEGQRVRAGDPIGEGGDVGRATNTHLHFEVLWRREGEPLDAARPSNPELWLEPALAGLGALAIRDAPPGAVLRGIRKPAPAETPYRFSESPHPDLAGLDAPGAGWLVFGDVPPGEWHLALEAPGAAPRRFAARITAGRLLLA